jgi:hypothetical protein
MIWAIVGYILAIVFPIPWLNSGIIDLWKNLGTKLGSWINAKTTTTPPS